MGREPKRNAARLSLDCCENFPTIWSTFWGDSVLFFALTAPCDLANAMAWGSCVLKWNVVFLYLFDIFDKFTDTHCRIISQRHSMFGGEHRAVFKRRDTVLDRKGARDG